MKSASAQLIDTGSVALLQDEYFVLRLESEMLFPEEANEEPSASYMRHLAIVAGALPHERALVPPRGAIGGKNTPFLPAPSPSISVDLDNHGIISHRVALHVTQGLASHTKGFVPVAHRVANGHVAAICLDMFRLLCNGDFQTRAGLRAEPSINKIAYVLEQYDFARARAKAGRPAHGNPAYPTLNEKRVKSIWRSHRHCTALWAAYRALSKSQWNCAPWGHLLEGLNAADFLRLSLKFEEERHCVLSKKPHSQADTIGPQSAFEELRSLLATHIPSYAVINKADEVKKSPSHSGGEKKSPPLANS